MQEQNADKRRPFLTSPDRPRHAGPGGGYRDQRQGMTSQMSRKHKILTTFYEPVRGSIREDARTGHRIYRLKGYTTVDKINRKFQQERNQRTLRNLLTFLMILILLVILIVIYNPFTNTDELKRISGEDSLYNKHKQTATSEKVPGFP